jgi:hypothetical protein
MNPPGRTQGDWLDSTQDLEDARARLERRSPQALAEFIVSLAQDGGPAGEQVLTFIVGEDGAAAAASLDRRIAALGIAPGRAAGGGGEVVGRRLAYILEAIETLVVPVDSRRAFELLVALIERDGDALECCGDHHDTVGGAMARAAELVEQVIRGLPREVVHATLQRLIAADDYGTRQPLAAVVRRLAPSGQEE